MRTTSWASLRAKYTPVSKPSRRGPSQRPHTPPVRNGRQRRRVAPGGRQYRHRTGGDAEHYHRLSVLWCLLDEPDGAVLRVTGPARVLRNHPTPAGRPVRPASRGRPLDWERGALCRLGSQPGRTAARPWKARRYSQQEIALGGDGVDGAARQIAVQVRSRST